MRQQCHRRSTDRGRRAIGRGMLTALAMVFLVLADGSRGAAQELGTALVMIEDRGCPYCARFDRDVREGYTRSPEGRFAPLLRRLRGASDVAFLGPITFSPTFVLLRDGREVGRIVGYQGPDLFWMEMAGLMRKAGFEPGAGG